MNALIIHLLTSLSLLTAAAPVESPAVVAAAAGDPKGNISFSELDRSEASAIESAYVKATEDQAAFDKFASEGDTELSCWSYPGNVGCWVGDWLVSCENNANTGGEWDCGVTHQDDLD